MMIVDRIREAKGLSQGDLERKTGLLRCYVSRVENGHTLPSLETMEKFARGLEVPIYHLLYDGEKPPKEVSPKTEESDPMLFGGTRKENAYLTKLR